MHFDIPFTLLPPPPRSQVILSSFVHSPCCWPTGGTSATGKRAAGGVGTVCTLSAGHVGTWFAGNGQNKELAMTVCGTRHHILECQHQIKRLNLPAIHQYPMMLTVESFTAPLLPCKSVYFLYLWHSPSTWSTGGTRAWSTSTLAGNARCVDGHPGDIKERCVTGEHNDQSLPCRVVFERRETHFSI